MAGESPIHPRYQDYVIKGGRLIGEFEQMYRDHEDPWQQAELDALETEKSVGISLVKRLGIFCDTKKVLELGCGFGHYSQRFAEMGFETIGIDISKTAIDKARELHPSCRFEVGQINDYATLKEFAPDVIVMSEISWYILDDLKAFLDFIREEMPQVYILHILTTYPPGEQGYGREYFTNLKEIMLYFKMLYLESGEVHCRSGYKPVWFLGTFDNKQSTYWPS